ncbi:hypothetical protein RUM43_014032 [Polyplax serrata]|uniref:Uncharacterized protein n=1 Tax=Polyplax serrata TaxID=468196 RepID=A0AAN8RYW8_POLSC
MVSGVNKLTFSLVTLQQQPICYLYSQIRRKVPKRQIKILLLAWILETQYVKGVQVKNEKKTKQTKDSLGGDVRN